MTHDEAFLADIRDRPDDDTPRLVYADWLDDHGEPARAEFIRVQCELARIEPTDDRVPELHLRQLELLAEHEREWLGPWADRLVRWRFQRGLLHEVTVQPEPFVASGADLFARHPVHTVAFVDDEGRSLASWEIARVLKAPHFALIRGLELSGCRPGERMFGMFDGAVETNAWLTRLAGAGQVTRLEAVNLPGGTRSGREPLDPDAFAAFCSAPHLASLRSLDLSDIYQTDGPDEIPALCDLLADATFSASLRRLSLTHVSLTDDALGRLASSSGLRGLEAVDLTHCGGLGAEALRAFLGSRPRGRLRELGLPGGLNLRELGDWSGLGDIEELRLSGATRHFAEDEWLGLFRSPRLRPTRLALSGPVPDVALAELFLRDWTDGLRSFDLDTAFWRPRPDPQVLALLLDRDAPRLSELSLPAADTLPRGRLAAWPVLPRLTRVDVAGNADFVMWLLSHAPLTPRLPRLDLGGQCSTDEAVAALAASPWARGVCHLDFGSNALTPAKVPRLAAAPFARPLEALHLHSEEAEEGQDILAALRVVADERHFPRLRDVVVGSGTVQGGIDALRRRFGPRLRVWSDC
jgi:uncharacterized protein (TIGR02996 family)